MLPTAPAGPGGSIPDATTVRRLRPAVRASHEPEPQASRRSDVGVPKQAQYSARRTSRLPAHRLQLLGRYYRPAIPAIPGGNIPRRPTPSRASSVGKAVQSHEPFLSGWPPSHGPVDASTPGAGWLERTSSKRVDGVESR